MRFECLCMKGVHLPPPLVREGYPLPATPIVL